VTSNAVIRTAWADNVFININNGENSYGYELNRTNQSATDLELGYYKQQIDFWEYFVVSTKQPRLMGKYQEKFTLTVRHSLAISENGAATSHQNLMDSLRTVNDLVITNLGTKWDNTVDYYEGPNDPSLSADTWGGKAIWTATQTYTAFKITN